MQTEQSMQEILKLPLNKKFFAVEQILKSIKSQESSKPLAMAAEALYDDYKNYKEPTVFSFEH